MSERTRTRLADLIDPLMPDAGVKVSLIPNVRLIKSCEATPRAVSLYMPGIAVVAQGSKQVWIGDDHYTYDANNFFVLAAPLPVECQTEASDDEPLLGLWISPDAVLVGELLLAMGDVQDVDPRRFAGSMKLTDDVIGAAERLVSSLSSPLDAAVLGPQLVRELVYRVLLTEEGHVLRLMTANASRYGQIARVVRLIHDDYAEDLDVASLAREARMGLTAFHQSFREVTATSPVQYIKSVRLHQARLLLTTEGLTAQEVARTVGYASNSQFSREYRRMFGVTPASDRKQLAV